MPVMEKRVLLPPDREFAQGITQSATFVESKVRPSVYPQSLGYPVRNMPRSHSGLHLSDITVVGLLGSLQKRAGDS